jgi:hypothetical protein
MGMLFGALFWGLSADIIGRRFAFNVSLFICSIFATVAGAAPNWIALCVFIALLGFGGGGNLILDTTVFLEYLPSDKQWVLSAYSYVLNLWRHFSDGKQLSLPHGGDWDKQSQDSSRGDSCVSSNPQTRRSH